MTVNTQYIMDRLNEPSTWRGLVNILIGLGVALKPEQVEAILAAGLFINGIIAASTKDAVKK
jgi:hypothetical protein